MGRPKRKTATTARASRKEYEYNEFSDIDGDDLHKSNSKGDPIDKPDNGDKWKPDYEDDLFEDINYEVNYEIKDEKEDPCYDRKQELLRDCKCLTESVRKPLNVAIIGPPGCGKSSFLNTVFASLNSDRWYEYAKCGYFGNHEDVMGMQITRHLRSFPKEEYYTQNDCCRLPTFIDMTGFENDDSVINEELLYLVFCGKVKEKEVLNDIVAFGRYHGITTMRQKYRNRFSYRKIDRIIIVCSSNPDSAMPSALLKTVVKVANELDITFYGVMTHADIFRAKYDKRVQSREKLFRETLGLPRNRLASVINYCPDVDPDRSYEDTLLPALDVPVLRLMRQILTPEPGDSTMNFGDYVNEVIYFIKNFFFIGCILIASQYFLAVDISVVKSIFYILIMILFILYMCTYFIKFNRPVNATAR
ncbi:unnamed protein product [Mytilus coruscus]|uniref:Uncharacterized protein n=1 Tax=Mytilus coruscus TaxID=42192 RepID=A0A6J8BG74_MYTCO|nr:unnamed protein product [Mytilus coruscus]